MVHRLGDDADHDVWVIDPYGAWTKREANDVLNRAANGLAALPRRTHQPVAVFAANSAEIAFVHTAGLYAGVPTLPVNALLRPDEVAYILQDSDAAALFVGESTAGAGRAAALGAGVPSVIGWHTDAAGVTPWLDWLAAQDPTEPSPDRPAAKFVFYTSGTTGFPKATTSRLPADIGTVREVVAGWLTDLDATVGASRHRLLVCGPMHHIAPMGSSVGGLMACGLVVLPRFDAAAVLAAIEEHRVGSTVLVPTHLRRLLALPDEVKQAADVSSVELIGLTGAACPVDVKRGIIDWFGPVVIEAYGATEAGAICRIDSQEWLAHPGSVGRCLPDFEPLVLGEDDRPLPRNEVGRLYFRDALGLGIEYKNAPDKTAAAHVAPGVFTIGDMGYVDDDGYVFITDRAVDMIVSGGVNIYPAEPERVLLRHPGVRDAAVIGVPDPDLGEAVLALVEPADPAAPPDAGELIAACRASLASYKCPRAIEYVESVGRSAMGKLNKRALRAPYWPTERTIG